MKRAFSIVRVAGAAYFLLVGILVLLFEAGLVDLPSPESEPRATAFLKAMTDTGFVNALLSVSFIAAALLLFRNRTAPLGIAILAPSVIGIFLFHVMLSGRLLWGSVWPVWLLALAWVYRRAFTPLCRYDVHGG